MLEWARIWGALGFCAGPGAAETPSLFRLPLPLFRLPLPEGCFLTVLFALEPNSATPSTPTLGLQLCGNLPAGSLYFQILRNGEWEFYDGVPVGMFLVKNSYFWIWDKCFFLKMLVFYSPSPSPSRTFWRVRTLTICYVWGYFL